MSETDELVARLRAEAGLWDTVGPGTACREYRVYDGAPLAELLRAAADRLAAPVGWCQWTENEDGAWQTGCGHLFEFHEGGPVENKQQFCGYCGLRLQEVPYGD